MFNKLIIAIFQTRGWRNCLGPKYLSHLLPFTVNKLGLVSHSECTRVWVFPHVSPPSAQRLFLQGAKEAFIEVSINISWLRRLASGKQNVSALTSATMLRIPKESCPISWPIQQQLIWKKLSVRDITVYRFFCFKMAKRKITGWKNGKYSMLKTLKYFLVLRSRTEHNAQN